MLLPIIIGATLIGGVPFGVMGIITAVIALLELRRIVNRWRGIFVVSPPLRVLLPFYILLPAFGIFYLRLVVPDGLTWIALVFALTWGTDTFAYIGGRLWGKTLLAPKISPKKTVEGAITGVIGAFFIGLIVLLITEKFAPVFLILLIGAPIAAIIGDLVESALKRAADVEESHLPGLNLFPGHGGVLDRIDSLIFVATVCALFIFYIVL